MIANPNYQLFVDNKATVDLKYGTAALKALNVGETCIINEENPSDSTAANIDDLKVFSIYQKVKNNKGKEVLIKHGGALPIVVDKVRVKTFQTPSAGKSQYWQLSFNASTFTPCCENYSIRFGMYNDAIQKTMFPSEYVETFSTENECCGRGCNNSDPFTADEIAFRIWLDVAYYNRESRGYVTAWMVDNSNNVVADSNGNVEFTYTDGSSHSHTVTVNVKDINDGIVSYTDTDTTADPDVTVDGEKNISDFVSLMGLSSSNVNLVFGIAAEDENNYGQMNFKYDIIRNTVARVTLNGGFECSNGVTLIKNDSTHYSSIKKASAGSSGSAVDQFAYSVGQNYDVHEMELADSLHTLNSPYTLSDVTLSENGINFRTKETGAASEYYLLTLEYQQPSDGVTRVEHHPWGTTFAIAKHTSNYTNWEYFLSLFSPSGTTWAVHS